MMVVPEVEMRGMDREEEELIAESFSNFTSSIETSVVVFVEGVSKQKGMVSLFLQKKA